MRWMVWVVLVVACHPGTMPDTGIAEVGGIGGDNQIAQTLNEEARDAIAQAAELLEGDRFQEAEEAFNAIGATYPAAEPFARVMALSASALSGAPDAMQELILIATNTDAPMAARQAAASYYAIALARSGDGGNAAEQIHRLHPGIRPSWLVLQKDRALAMMLLAQGALANADIQRAVRALSWAFQLGDPQTRVFARDQCVRALRKAPDSFLEDLTEDEDDFISALAGATLIRRGLAAQNDTQSLAALQTRFEQAAPALVRIDAGQEAEILSSLLDAAQGPRPIRIGVALPLSGRARGVGGRALGGILLAHGALNPAADPQSTVIIEDTASTPQGAIRAIEALSKRNVSVIIGPLDEREASTAATAAQSAGVPLITMTMDTNVVDLGDQVFRLFIDTHREVDALVQRAASNGARRLGIAYPDGPLGRTLAQVATRSAQDNGLAVVSSVGYNPSSNDFSKIAAQFARGQVDSVFIPDVATRVSVILPFLASKGLWCMPPGSKVGTNDTRTPVLCLGNVLWHDPALLRDGGSYANGAIILAGWSPLADTAPNQQFVSEYRGTMGREPDVFSAFAYDALRLSRHLVITGHKRTPSQCRDGLMTLIGFDGLTGVIAGKRSGELVHQATWITVSDGAFKLLEPLQ